MTSKHKTFRLFEWKSCRQQGLRLWECPSFLFLFTGGVTVILMLATYFVSQIYASVEITLASIVIVTTFMMVIAFIMDQTMTKVAQARIHLHRTNHELKTAVAKLEHSEKLRRDFTSMVIHDLKSPLKGVQLLGESVKKIHSVVSFKQLAVIGKTIETSAVRMIDLVNNLLMIDKVDAGKFIIVRKTGSVEALLRDQIAIVKPQAREKHITLALMVPKKLPQLAFDRAQTERILGNILSNAIKFTPKKGRVMVHAFVHARGGHVAHEAGDMGVQWFVTAVNRDFHKLPRSVIIGVTDTGPGLKAKDIQQSFDKFHQVHVARDPEHEGTGLGLAVAKAVAEAQGGIVGAQSQVKKGSTFYFTLPF